MSELVTNKITPGTGSSDTVTLGDSGDTFSIPSGATIANSGTATGFLPAAGTSGNVLTSNGSSWASAAGGGAWTVKSSGTLTTASTLEVTGITGTTMIFLNLEQSAATDSILMRTSSDGGTTYDSGASDYYRNNWDLLQQEGTPAYNKSDFASFLLHGARGSSNPAGDHMAMAVRIIRPQDSFAHTHFLSDYTGTANVGSGSEGFHGHSGGFRKSAGIVNAIKIFSSSGGTMSGGYEIIHL